MTYFHLFSQRCSLSLLSCFDFLGNFKMLSYFCFCGYFCNLYPYRVRQSRMSLSPPHPCVVSLSPIELEVPK